MFYLVCISSNHHQFNLQYPLSFISTNLPYLELTPDQPFLLRTHSIALNELTHERIECQHSQYPV